MIYEFWDIRTNNILAAYDSKDAAFEAIRKAVHDSGPLALEWVVLLEDDPAEAEKNFVGVGSELLVYAVEVSDQ